MESKNKKQPENKPFHEIHDSTLSMLMVGTETKLFDPSSEARERIAAYGRLVHELHIIVLSTRGIPHAHDQKIADNVWVYPTNSRIKLFYVLDARRLAKRINKEKKLSKYDHLLVSAQDPFESGLAGKRIARLLKARLQIQVHTDFLSPHFRRASILNRVRVLVARQVLESSDCVRVVSKRIKDTLESKYKLRQPPVVLPVFIDFEKIKTKASTFDLHERYPQFEFIILLVSRLEREKDILLALNALRKIKEKYPKVGLIIVGDGSERQVLEEAVKEKGLDDTVIFEGWQRELISYYKTADLFLNTSLYEGFGRTLLEAAVAACPIVTTDVGLVGEIFDAESVAVCNVGDDICVVTSIVRLIGDDSARSALAAKSYQVAVGSMPPSLDAYLRLYQQYLRRCFHDRS